MPKWPVLSWLAVCERGSGCIRVFHGTEVETRPEWFCEAVWDGAFADGNFDQTDLVFGSGARWRNGTVSFVSSGATVDRLQYLELDSCALISNSLACLLAVAGTEPDPEFRGYKDLFASIQDGLAQYDRRVPLVTGAAQLVYFHNLQWNNFKLQKLQKVVTKRDLSSYANYIAFLRQSLKYIAANMSSADRMCPYGWQGTLSRGYDSPAGVALAKDYGLNSVISFHQSRPGVQDDGKLIAQAIGVEIDVMDRLEWQRDGIWEPAFLSADGQGKEVFISAARERLRRRVFVTGFGGDYVWAKKPQPITPELVRGGYAGLSLTEFRLHCGFINLAVPHMGMTQVADICRISQSPELSNWDIGGSYSRPIPRRLLEERGVPRELFGMAKTGASIRYVIGQDAWSANGYKAYLRWLWFNPKFPSNRLIRLVWVVALTIFRMLLLISDFAPHTLGRVVRRGVKFSVRVLGKLGFQDHFFHWAIAHIGESYKGVYYFKSRVQIGFGACR